MVIVIYSRISSSIISNVWTMLRVIKIFCSMAIDVYCHEIF